MSHAYTSDLIRSCFKAYEAKDRDLIESLLSDDFTFTSPLDDNISRELYFERCWPNSEHFPVFHIEKLFVDGGEAFVTYLLECPGGVKIRNTEFFVIEDDKIKHVDVYFGTEDSRAASESELRALINETVTACCNKDTTALIALYDSNVVAFDLISPLRYKGTDALRLRVEEWFESFSGPIAYDLRDLQVAASGEVGFCHSLNHVSGTQGEQKIDMWWRATLGFEKRKGRWLITHSHSSEPFEMTTGKAAFDLKP